MGPSGLTQRVPPRRWNVRGRETRRCISMPVADSAAPSSRDPKPRKRWALGNGLYERTDGRFEHGFTHPSDGRWHVVTLAGKTKTDARREIAERITRLGRGEVA